MQNDEDTTKGQLILRDRLAENRTVLANERTFLAYVRTALALFAAGVSFIQFFHSEIIVVLGWVFLPIGVYTLFKGLASFAKMKRVIREEENQEVSKPQK